jgi:hypothetical protein
MDGDFCQVQITILPGTKSILPGTNKIILPGTKIKVLPGTKKHFARYEKIICQVRNNILPGTEKNIFSAILKRRKSFNEI